MNLIDFEPRRWEDEQRDYLDKSEEIEAAAWISAGIVVATIVAALHEAWIRFGAP